MSCDGTWRLWNPWVQKARCLAKVVSDRHYWTSYTVASVHFNPNTFIFLRPSLIATGSYGDRGTILTYKWECALGVVLQSEVLLAQKVLPERCSQKDRGSLHVYINLYRGTDEIGSLRFVIDMYWCKWGFGVVFSFEHNHTPSRKKTVTGMQVVTTSQVQIMGCRSKAIL